MMEKLKQNLSSLTSNKVISVLLKSVEFNAIPEHQIRWLVESARRLMLRSNSKITIKKTIHMCWRLVSSDTFLYKARCNVCGSYFVPQKFQNKGKVTQELLYNYSSIRHLTDSDYRTMCISCSGVISSIVNSATKKKLTRQWIKEYVFLRRMEAKSTTLTQEKGGLNE